MYSNHRTTPRSQIDTTKYEITEEKGHHDRKNCPCREVTDGGHAYRDVVAERITNEERAEWDRIRFYHQAPIVKKNADIIEVDTHGFGNSSTTRERINLELPKGFRIAQRDYSVKLKLPNGDLIDVPENFRILPENREILNAETGELIMHYVDAE